MASDTPSEIEALAEENAMLAALVVELADAFEECTGDYPKDLCADVLAAAAVVRAKFAAVPVPAPGPQSADLQTRIELSVAEARELIAGLAAVIR